MVCDAIECRNLTGVLDFWRRMGGKPEPGAEAYAEACAAHFRTLASCLAPCLAVTERPWDRRAREWWC
jgi:hypothetical protein